MATENIMPLDYLNPSSTTSPFQPDFTQIPTSTTYYGDSTKFIPNRTQDSDDFPSYIQPTYPKPPQEDGFAPSWGCEPLRSSFYPDDLINHPGTFQSYPGAEWKRNELVYSPKSQASNTTQPLNIVHHSDGDDEAMEEEEEEEDDEGSISGESCVDEQRHHHDNDNEDGGAQMSFYAPGVGFHHDRFSTSKATMFQRTDMVEHFQKIPTFGMSVKSNEVGIFLFRSVVKLLPLAWF